MSRALFSSFKMFVRSIISDGMLLFMLIMPVLLALLFCLAIPALVEQFDWTFLPPYYILFDLFLSTIAPTFWIFASSMAILDEMDCGISRHLMVTPIGKNGYLASRLGFPLILAYPITCIILYFANLSGLTVGNIVELAFLGTISSLLSSLLVVVVASNRVEGMAINKLGGLLGMGCFVPFFIHGWQQYIFSFLPSFWLAKFAMTRNYFHFAIVLVVTAAISYILFRKYNSKIH